MRDVGEDNELRNVRYLFTVLVMKYVKGLANFEKTGNVERRSHLFFPSYFLILNFEGMNNSEEESAKGW